MRRKGERGAAQLSSIISLLALVAVAWAAWNVGPMYFANYDFADKVNEIARTPKYRAPRTTRSARCSPRRFASDGSTSSSPGRTSPSGPRDTSRRIEISYERTAKVLPGWERTFEFNIHADQPLI